MGHRVRVSDALYRLLLTNASTLDVSVEHLAESLMRDALRTRAHRPGAKSLCWASAGRAEKRVFDLSSS